MSLNPTSPATTGATTKKLRSACDSCHEVKLKCNGGQPCVRCQSRDMRCVYSYAARIGKPKGSKNKKTVERLRQLNIEASARGGASSSNSNKINDNNKRRTTEPESGEYNAGGAEAEDANSAGAGEDEIGYSTDHMDYDEDSADGHVEGPQKEGLRETALTRSLNHYTMADSHKLCHPHQPGIANHANSAMSKQPRHMSFEDFGLLDVNPLGHTHSGVDENFWNILPSEFIPSLPSDNDTITISPSFFDIPPGTSPRNITTCPVMQKHSANHDTRGGTNFGLGGLDQVDIESFEAFLKEPTPKTVSTATEIAIPSAQKDKKPHNCLKLQTEALCRLKHVGEYYHGAPPSDTVLFTVTQILDSCKGPLECNLCSVDHDCQLLAIMTMRIMTCWLQGIVSPSSKTAANVKLTLGSYEISGEDGALIKNVLISRAVEKSGANLKLLRERSCSLAASNSREEVQKWDNIYIRLWLQKLHKDLLQLDQDSLGRTGLQTPLVSP